jgi:hypothetical protein
VRHERQASNQTKNVLKKIINVGLQDTLECIVSVALVQDARSGREKTRDLSAKLLVTLAILLDCLRRELTT